MSLLVVVVVIVLLVVQLPKRNYIWPHKHSQTLKNVTAHPEQRLHTLVLSIITPICREIRCFSTPNYTRLWFQTISRLLWMKTAAGDQSSMQVALTSTFLCLHDVKRNVIAPIFLQKVHHNCIQTHWDVYLPCWTSRQPVATLQNTHKAQYLLPQYRATVAGKTTQNGCRHLHPFGLKLF